MLFEWDEAKSETNLRLRGIGFRAAASIFAGLTLEWRNTRRDYGEIRIRAIGDMDGRIVHVVYTIRGEARRIISARLANRKERLEWQSRE